MNYVRVTPDLIVGGVVVADLPFANAASKKRRKDERGSIVRTADLERLVAVLEGLEAEVKTDFDARRATAIEEYLASESYRSELLAELKANLDANLNQSHDFINLLAQIRSNVTTIFEQKFPGTPPEEAAERLPNEGAIFFATELMLAKIDATKYLREPNLVYGNVSTFQLHRFVSKYIKIYQSYAAQKALDFVVSGSSFGWVAYNSDAIGAAVLAVLDNLVKYAPAGSKADVVFRESNAHIDVHFLSLGPRIDTHELTLIFRVGFRAAAALELDAGGLGFGLAAAKLIADSLDLSLTTKQSPDADSDNPGFFSTEFSLRFGKVAQSPS